MSYTALEKMRKRNAALYSADYGPFQPKLSPDVKTGMDLKSAALRMLHQRCEGLLFDDEKETLEEKNGVFAGTSLKANQIPYNMQRDIDRLCLARSLERFLDSGTQEDAYTVYYCYIQMFLGQYAKTKRMIEFLSEYETNGGSLLLKHRDHYTHSVYVFALGLAVYEANEAYRRSFDSYYASTLNADAKGNESKKANFFLQFWGLTALFHDIGYPFELPFEQVLSYFETDNQGRGKTVYLSYRNMDCLSMLGAEEQQRFVELYHREFVSIEEVFAYVITSKLGDKYSLDEAHLYKIIADKPTCPEQYDYHIDHAYFSAIRLYKELIRCMTVKRLSPAHMDALTAILLHNSLFKFAVANKKGPLPSELHPFAFLLMLCDELQCWDRTAYGRNTRTELYPMAAHFDFSEQMISVIYDFDEREKNKIEKSQAAHDAWRDGRRCGNEPRLKAYSDIVDEDSFVHAIYSIVDLSLIPLSVAAVLEKPDFNAKHRYLSSSNFLHLFDFAVILYGRNHPEKSSEELAEEFQSMSLEYQLSSINRAKAFGRYLDAIHCFFTDRSVHYELVEEFTKEQIETIAPLEHARWIREHCAMGWSKGAEYESLTDDKNKQKALREQMRRHKLAMNGDPTDEEIRKHYLELDEEDQDKDMEPFNKMLVLLKKYDGLRIYRFDSHG